jgi:hypothetical protein
MVMGGPSGLSWGFLENEDLRSSPLPAASKAAAYAGVASVMWLKDKAKVASAGLTALNHEEIISPWDLQ